LKWRIGGDRGAWHGNFLAGKGSSIVGGSKGLAIACQASNILAIDDVMGMINPEKARW